jgi:hypothetical protein
MRVYEARVHMIDADDLTACSRSVALVHEHAVRAITRVMSSMSIECTITMHEACMHVVKHEMDVHALTPQDGHHKC